MTSPIVVWHAIVLLLVSVLPISLCLKPEAVIVAHHAAIATDDGRCSEIGKNILSEGGHAIDAAVAASLCLGVVSPASSGIGGGSFMLLRLANGETQAVDMRETAPMHASENMYNGNATLKARGPLSIAVPGQLVGLYQVWKQHGRLPWEKLVKPAEVLAREFEISPYLYTEMLLVQKGIIEDKGLRDVFTRNGKLLQEGDICHNKKLAETLSIISKEGAEAFYHGSIGEKLIGDIQTLGAIITMEDLQRYQLRMREHLTFDTLGLKILGMPPPSSGGVGLTLLFHILARYNLPSSPDALGTHRLIEAFKHIYAIRMNLGDPDFVNITQVVSDMLSPEFAKQLQKTIYDNMTFGPNYYGGKWKPIMDHGTSHMSIVDEQGNAIALTSSVNDHFGSLILSPSTGILLNNHMDDFSMPGNFSSSYPPPAPANFIRPGKRPLSSMTPTIILKNEKLIAVAGASGGPMIIPTVGQVILNHFIKRMNENSSIMAPRVYHRWLPNVVFFENFTSVTNDHFELSADIRKSLQEKGHKLQSLDSGGICQFITVKPLNEGSKTEGMKQIVAVSDPRKGGSPAGF